MRKMVQKRVKTKVKWERKFYLMKYPDGNYVTPTSGEPKSKPKPVDKSKAYLFTSSKAEEYLNDYSELNLEIVPVTVYLE